MGAKKGYRQLGTTHAARLGAWVAHDITAYEHMTVDEIAAKAKTEMTGMDHLTPGMVRDLFNQLGIKFKPSRGLRKSATPGTSTHIVAVALRDLYERLGIPVPPQLLAAVSRRRLKEDDK